MAESTGELLDRYFDTAFEAPNGIARLRELILSLAMQGKLVPQDPTDEPASVLLERIRAEKARLVKEGALKKQKPLPEIKAGEVPYELPEGWEWCRLGDATIYNGRSKVSSSIISEDCWILDLEDIEKDSSRLLKKEVFKNRLSKSTKSAFLKNDVLYGKLRPYLNKVIVADEDGVCTTEIVPINTLGCIEPVYLKFFLRSPRFIKYVNDLMYGVKMPRLGTNDALITQFPLPPLKEQQRIVQRIDQLMARCDALEGLREERQGVIVQVHQAALQGMLSADGTEVFQRNWGFLSRNFSDLYSVRDNVAELRKAVLQLAVMGKLVEQDPNDEPAAVLLERIRAEKARLVKEGKVKKQKALPEIKAEEVPYELPEGWEWCRFDQLINQQYPISYGVLVPGPNVEDGVPFVRIEDLSIDNPNEMPNKKISKEIAIAYERTKLVGGEILMGVVGSIGKLGIAPQTWRNAYIARAVCRIAPISYVYKKYILWILQSDFMQNSFISDTRTLAQPTLNIGLIRASLTPLPPYSEQKRIVHRINVLMGMCDLLEEKIDGGKKVQGELLDAVMAGV